MLSKLFQDNILMEANINENIIRLFSWLRDIEMFEMNVWCWNCFSE